MTFGIVGSPGWALYDQRVFDALRKTAIVSKVLEQVKAIDPTADLSQETEFERVLVACAITHYDEINRPSTSIVPMLEGLEPGCWMDILERAIAATAFDDSTTGPYLTGAFAALRAQIMHLYWEARRRAESSLPPEADFRVAICGPARTSPRPILDTLHAQRGPIGCVLWAGADRFNDRASAWAMENGTRAEPYHVDWTESWYPDTIVRYRRDGLAYDARAPFRRNERLLRETQPHLVVVYPNGPGAKDLILRAQSAGIEVLLPPPAIRRRPPAKRN